MSGYYEETYQVYSEEPFLARKPHTCCACGETIPAKTQYWRIATIYDGHVTTYKRCRRCQRIHLHLRELCRGTDRWPDEQLACGLTYEDEWGALPDEIAALAFALPHDFEP